MTPQLTIATPVTLENIKMNSRSYRHAGFAPGIISHRREGSVRALDVTQEDFQIKTGKLAIYVQPVSTGTTTHTKNTVSALYASQELIKNFLTARRLRAKTVQRDFTFTRESDRIASHVSLFFYLFH